MASNMVADKKPDSEASIYLSIVIPAYNEERRIGKTLDKIISYLDSRSYPSEIIVVNDGSSDRTSQFIKEFSDKYEQVHMAASKVNCGKGFSIRKGMLISKGRYVLFSDADLSTPIEEVEKLMEWLRRGYDIAIGSRGLKESDIQIHQSWYRERMGKIFNLLVQLIAVKGIKDTQCGFKCFKREVIQEIFRRQTISQFSFDVELLWIALKHGYRIKEVPVQWMNNPSSKVNPVLDSTYMFLDLIKIRINDLRGLYH
ncbi:MAG TPA: glycosyl transferase [Nitrospiraceae bacterium]|nr:glycosyl transferase [Nitrospiraceae bacterium]HBI23196.1 glycosyl transferase [Nitrospiraceae bacterium]